ncbi:MAG: DUF4293 domain-containing protein [Chlorobiaceae bacterium]|nr:DUF4293 domain-containing protein [Chlorobiaceae bacterium]
MLSRIQSLYLFLAALLAFGSMAMPFWTFTAGHIVLFGDFMDVQGAGIVVSAGSIAGGIFSPLTGIASLAAIFQFRNRKLQQKLILACFILFAGDLVSGLAGGHFLKQYLETSATQVTFIPGGGMFMILPEPVLFWLATLGIKKDEKIATAYKRL